MSGRDFGHYVHFVCPNKGTLFRKRSLGIPRTGDVLRLADGVYYTAGEVIWCYDENSDMGQRVNVEIKEMEE